MHSLCLMASVHFSFAYNVQCIQYFYEKCVVLEMMKVVDFPGCEILSFFIPQVIQKNKIGNTQYDLLIGKLLQVSVNC